MRTYFYAHDDNSMAITYTTSSAPKTSTSSSTESPMRASNTTTLSMPPAAAIFLQTSEGIENTVTAEAYYTSLLAPTVHWRGLQK